MKTRLKFMSSTCLERSNAARKKAVRRSGSWLLAVFMVLVISTSCNKFLDIQPEGEFTSDQLLKDDNGFQTAMYGVYATMADENLYGENLSYSILDVLAQYFVSPQNTYVEALLKYDYKLAAVEAEISATWSKSYNNISNINNVLKNLDRFDTNSLRHYNLYKGEALGLRAFLHFDLVRMYTENIQLNSAAQGIPYSTEFGLQSPEFLPLAEVYNKIIADLTTAETLLAGDQHLVTFPKTNGSDNYLKDRETHFNLYAVQATLARVYLTKGDLPNALVYAEKVINANKHQLLTPTEVADGRMRGVLYPKEAIFGLFTNTLFARVNNLFYLNTTRLSYSPRSLLRESYNVNSLEGKDNRGDGFFGGSPLRFVKLVDPYQLNPQLEFQRPAGLIKGINLIRIPEMYYIAAEALLSTNPEKARSYFDIVITSRGLVGLKDRLPAVPLTLDLIVNERSKELIGEGQTFFNMKRLNQNITSTQQQVIPASKEIYVLPIPLIEFEYRD